MELLKGIKDLWFGELQPLPESVERTGIWPYTGNPREWIDPTHPDYTPSIYADAPMIDVTGSGQIKPIIGSAKSAVSALRKIMSTESRLRGKPLKSIAPSKVGDLVESPIGKVRYDGAWEAIGDKPELFQYTPMEGPAKGMTFATKTQNLDDIAKGALKIAGKPTGELTQINLKSKQHKLRGLIDETSRGLWLHGRGQYPKTGETFADSRIKVGNLGEPYGISLTADKALLERSFAKSQGKITVGLDVSDPAIFSEYKASYDTWKGAQDIINNYNLGQTSLKEYHNALATEKSMKKYMTEIMEQKGHTFKPYLHGGEMLTPEQLNKVITSKIDPQTPGIVDPDMLEEYSDLYNDLSDAEELLDDPVLMKESGFTVKETKKEIIETKENLFDMLDSADIDSAEFKDVPTPGQMEKLASKAVSPPFARVFPKFGGVPGEKILPAWVAPETRWAQKIIADTYIESLPDEVKEILEENLMLTEVEFKRVGLDRSETSVSGFIKDAFEEYAELKGPSATEVTAEVIREDFNKRISENLQKKGYKALLYSPERYNEYELRMLNPDDVMMLDLREQKDPALKRMYQTEPLTSVGTGTSLMHWIDPETKKLTKLTPEETVEFERKIRGQRRGSSQAKRLREWKEQAAPREGASLRNIYEKITWEDIKRVLNPGPIVELNNLIKEADTLLK